MDTSALPPRPDPRTGLPRPPHGPLEAGWTADKSDSDLGGVSSPPPAQGPILEHYRPSKGAALGTGGIVVALLVIYASIRLHGLSWMANPKAWFLWSVIIVTVPLYYFSLRTKRVFAGADWLQCGKQWIRTYELTKVSLKRSGANMMIDLTDRGGRNVRVPWSRLQYNRALWDLVYNGILHSVCLGHAETDAGARRHLNLPGNP